MSFDHRVAQGQKEAPGLFEEGIIVLKARQASASACPALSTVCREPSLPVKHHAPVVAWDCGRCRLELTHHGVVMGILNVTPDSFSDGGCFLDVESALRRALQMEQEGAEIIDIGGESTRPGASPVTEEEERRRVIPVLRALRARTNALLSIDTSKSEIARIALLEGADIINDVTALRGDPRMAAVVAEASCGIVLMHMQGTPRTMQMAPQYADVVAEVRDFLSERLRFCASLGISEERLCVDPGIGFGKTFDHNRAILTALEQINPTAELGNPRPLLLGISRKSFLGAASDTQTPEGRLWPGAAITAWARQQGVRIFRVHDVREHLHALRVAEALLSHV